MIAFWLLAALVAVVALALSLRPLLARRRAAPPTREELNLSVYRDQLRELEADRAAGTLAQADYERSREELERRLLAEVDTRSFAPTGKPPRETRGKLPAIVAGVAIPLLALGVYFVAGNPGALDPAAREPREIGLKEIEAMVQNLADRLEQNPEDLEGWKMLGKSYAIMGRFAESANAYSKAAMRAPRDPQLLADLADAIAMARGQKMAGEPEELVQRALQIDPRNVKALALAGSAAHERSDYRAAARYWERMLPELPADSEERRTVQANIDEARTLAKEQGKKAAGKAPAGTEEITKTVEGTVRLAPALAAKVGPEDTLFIFARAAEGPPMPIAVVRRPAKGLPAKFVLDDSSAMRPDHRLSDAARVVVVARVSKSGNATPRPGDLQGTSAPVTPGVKNLTIVIDTEVR